MTMKKKAIAYGFTAFMALAIFAAMMPTAAAQSGINVIIEPGDTSKELVKPEVGLVSVPVKVTLKIPAASGCTANIQVDHKVSNPSYATAYMSPSGHSFTYESEGVPFASAAPDEEIVNTKLVVSTNTLAPAYQDGDYQLTSTVIVTQAPNCQFSGGTQTQKVSLKNDYFPLIEALPDQTTLKAGQNSDVRFPITVTNFGNGQTRINSDATYTSEARLDALIPPSSFVLESKAQQGTAAKDDRNVFVTVRTPHSNGYTNSIYSFQVNFVGEYAGADLGGEKTTDQQSVALSLQVQGVYAPGFDPTMLIGALGVALLGIRRMTKVE